jgi:hypothetical protein
MSEEVVQTPITAASQVDEHIRENYEQVRQERGWSWEQMANEFDKQNSGLLARWARECASNGDVPVGIESRAEASTEAHTADAPGLMSRMFGRGNASDLDAEDRSVDDEGSAVI